MFWIGFVVGFLAAFLTCFTAFAIWLSKVKVFD